MLRGLVVLLVVGGCDALFRINAVADAAPPDTAPDTNVSPPTFTIASHIRFDGAATSSFTLAIPPGSNRLLVVSVEIAVDPSSSTTTTVTSIVAAGQAMTPITTVTGVPGALSRSEQWQLVAPVVGTDDIAILLDSVPLTVHANALAFTGVNQTTPVRASNYTSGQAITADVTVPSEPTDLVESTVGCGNAIVAPALGGMVVFIDNGDGSNSLNNAAGSTAPGVRSAVDMGWSFAAPDNYQIIAASLEP